MIRKWIEFACTSCDASELADKIVYEFNTRFTSRAGDASVRNGVYTIRLSSILWDRATEDQRRQLVIHETCHLIAVYFTGRKCGHNFVWKGLMRRCGLIPKRCHNINTSDLKQKREKVTVYCRCGRHEIGTIRAARMRSGKRVYLCRRCRSRLSFVPLRGLSVMESTTRF